MTAPQRKPKPQTLLEVIERRQLTRELRRGAGVLGLDRLERLLHGLDQVARAERANEAVHAEHPADEPGDRRVRRAEGDGAVLMALDDLADLATDELIAKKREAPRRR